MNEDFLRHRTPSRRSHRAEKAARIGRNWPLWIFSGLLLSLVIPLIGSRLVAARGPQACQGEHTQLVIAAATDVAALLQGMADDFSQYGADAAGRCVAIKVLPYRSDVVQQRLVAGWQDKDGPAPDVYAPADRMWLSDLEQQLRDSGKAGLVPDIAQVPSIATSPQVVALPRVMATALGWPAQLIGWADLVKLARDPKGWGSVGHPEWGKFSLGKANPGQSQAALNASIGVQYAAVAVPGRIKTKDLTEADLRNPQAQEFVSTIEGSVLRYGPDVVDFLRVWREFDARGPASSLPSAVVTEERIVQSYNEGVMGGSTVEPGSLPAPKVQLAAVYPKEGTTFIDHPYAVLTASWVTAAKRDAAAAFLEYLLSDKVQAQWQDANFRSADRRAGAKAQVSAGVQPFQPSIVLENPSPAVVQSVLATWRERRKPVNAAIVLDASKNMAGTMPTSKRSTLADCVSALVPEVAKFGDRDRLGLWAAARPSAQSSDIRQLTPIRQLAKSGASPPKDALRQALAGVRPGGASGLYNAISAAQLEVTKVGGPEKLNAVVVISNGKNDIPKGLALTDLLKLITGPAGTGPLAHKFPIPIITVAVGPTADRAGLAKIAATSAGASYAADTAAEIPVVLEAAFANLR